MGVITIRDMLYVKNLERRLNRNLTEDELNEEELELHFPDGHREWVVIPRLVFPDDLLSAPELGAFEVINEVSTEEESFQYTVAS